VRISEQNVEVVRRIYEHFSAMPVDAGGRDAAPGAPRAGAALLVELDSLDLGVFAPEVAVDMSNFEMWPERRLYEGHSGVREFLRDWLEPWETYEHHLEGLRDADDAVVAILHVSGTAHGVAVEASFAHVWAVVDGTVVRVTAYSDPARTLEAVGLRE
jgi:ketosteroid isomerase-like protein